MQQRYYDPIAGRFLSVDPVVTDAATGRSFGRYHYGENNPYKFKDPDGRDPEHHHPAGGLSRTESRAAEATGAGMALGLVVPGVEAAGLASEGKYVAAAVSFAVDIGPGKVAKVVDKVAGAAKEATTVIGRVKDLKALGPGEKSLLDRLPNLGNPKANWQQNSGVLRENMRLGKPIRDASPGDTAGQFLNAERGLLQDRGWTFDPNTSFWNPPAKP